MSSCRVEVTQSLIVKQTLRVSHVGKLYLVLYDDDTGMDVDRRPRTADLKMDVPQIPDLVVEIPGSITLFVATAIFVSLWYRIYGDFAKLFIGHWMACHSKLGKIIMRITFIIQILIVLM